MKKFAGVVLIIFLSVYALIATEPGLHVSYRLARLFIPGSLDIQALHGKIVGPLSLGQLQYTNQDIQLSLQSVYLDWKVADLFKKRFNINKLNAKNVKILLIPAINNKHEPSLGIDEILNNLVSWIKFIEIGQASINNLAIYQKNDSIFQLDSLMISPNVDGSRNLVVDSSQARLKGTYHFHYQPIFSWRLSFDNGYLNLKNLANRLTGEINFTLRSQGRWSDKQKNMHLNVSHMKGKINQYDLNGVIDLSLKNSLIRFDKFDLDIADARMNVAGILGEGQKLSWQLTVPQLSHIIPDARGYIESQGEILTRKNQPDISASIIVDRLAYAGYKINKINGKISSRHADGTETTTTIHAQGIGVDKVKIPSVKINASTSLVRGKLNSKLKIALDDSNYILGALHSPSFDINDLTGQTISGNYVVHLSELTKLNNIFSASEVKDLDGQVTGTVDIQGKLGNPKVIADINLSQGSIFVTAAGMKVKNLSMQAAYRNKWPIKFDGSFFLGGGSARIDGEVDWKNDNISADVALKGDNLLVANTAEYQIKLSPDVNITYEGNNINVTGKVLVPEAKIAPEDFTASTSLPAEVVIVNHKKNKRLPTNMTLSVAVTMGDKVFLDFYNLKATLKGNLHIMQNLGNPPTGFGELNIVDGTYKAYGRHLVIEQGRLIYTGNLLLNPGINLKAYQNVRRLAYSEQFESSLSYNQSGQLSVGLIARGTLKKPTLSFYSNPPGLSQGDIISYLILGYPQSQAAGASAMALLNVASGMTGANTDGIASGIQGKLGLDELEVGSTEYFDGASNKSQSSTTVNVGRHLGKKLSLHYSVGIFDPVSILSLRYKISKYFSLQTETSTIESGGDILYHVESKD